MSNGSQLGSVVTVGQDKPIDREKVCPMLLRLFSSNHRHNPIREFNNSNNGSVPPNEVFMHTWMDCTLRELTTLIKEVNPDARRKGITFEFAIVSPDRSSPRYLLREIGSTQNGQRGLDDSKTLQQCKFEPGDFIDVAIINPGGRRFPSGPTSGREIGGDRFHGRLRSPVR
ncbi:Protein CBG20155 [Caenorhabditis briggsae]|uniref:18 kDa Sin3-associated polypeptide n=3 Tax=Caenorhabditis TaxID=6237 RepID=A0AAE9EJL5_CAEBR|nr:Protein CBG20155 [Caenorhabditis briggsae]PIC39722.1 hypothetical protein B9Z55_011321 [Caenorhabditis nigoni]ULU02685.1 hypothetical protein L3Y34_002342 [Caenorhabditis briggsae]UMM25303.1 hypothetical protein L5515_005183 [Caenorhabditis briggsae]CAP37277.1 Protein CBG20155 [Caenorhabditis briggsae]